MANVQLNDEEQIMVLSALNAYRKRNKETALQFASSGDADKKPLAQLYQTLADRAEKLIEKVSRANL